MHNGLMHDSHDDPIPTSDFSGQKPQKDMPLTVRRRINWSDSDTAEIAYTGSFIPIAIGSLSILIFTRPSSLVNVWTSQSSLKNWDALRSPIALK